MRLTSVLPFTQKREFTEQINDLTEKNQRLEKKIEGLEKKNEGLKKEIETLKQNTAQNPVKGDEPGMDVDEGTDATLPATPDTAPQKT